MPLAEIIETPQISRPRNVEIMEKEDATFEVQVVGKPYPEVDWYHNDTRLVPSDLVMLETEDTTHRVTLRTCEVGQTGQIQVTATNKGGSSSTEARLLVKGWHCILLMDIHWLLWLIAYSVELSLCFTMILDQ